MRSLCRRKFLKLGAFSLALGPHSYCNDFKQQTTLNKAIPWSFHEPELALGHLLRDPSKVNRLWQEAQKEEEVEVLIAGGGVAGLSATRSLSKARKELLLIDPGNEWGGTASSLSYQGLELPLGAHYLVSPPDEAHELLTFLTEAGVIKSWENGLPQYDEKLLIPETSDKEQSFEDGSWRPGINDGGTQGSSKLSKFEAFYSFLSSLKGKDGKRWFVVPTGKSSRDPKAMELFQIPFLDYLKENDLWDEVVQDVVDYACMDDYGCLAKDVSAWVGLHYFSCRPQNYLQRTLSHPSGNGYLVKKLLNTISRANRRKGTILLQSRKKEKQWISLLRDSNGRSYKVKSQQVLFGGKSHALPAILGSTPSSLNQNSQLSWLVSNILLKKSAKHYADKFCWDNVIGKSPSVGFIYANFLDQNPDKQAAITHFVPVSSRLGWTLKDFYSKSLNQLQELVLSDFQRALPEVIPEFEEVICRRIAHAMSLCPPGFVLPSINKSTHQLLPGFFAANSDQYGLPLFEEAFQSGIEAAGEALSAS